MRKSKNGAMWKSAAARRLIQLAPNSTTVEDAVRVVVGRILEDIACPPTDLEAIRQRLNITGYYAEPLPVSGELRRNDRGYQVIYSSYLSPPRQRFTIAHEIGHVIFEATGPNCPYYGKELERICDMIATEILMPRPAFTAAAGDEITLDKLKELQRTFKTSLSATAIRCKELCGVSAFEVEAQAVKWGCGIVRKGPVQSLHYLLQPTVRAALMTPSGREVLNLVSDEWTGKWRMEWEELRTNHVFFLLQPIRPLPEWKKYRLVSPSASGHSH